MKELPEEDLIDRAAILLRHKTNERDREAFELLEPLARAGFARAQVLLGWMREVGRGCDQDPVLAEHLYRGSADQQYASAQFYLGTLYRKRGQHDLAVAQFMRAAEQSFLPAYFRVALHELVRNRNGDAAMALFLRAERKGHLPSAIRRRRIILGGKADFITKVKVCFELPFLILRFALMAAKKPNDERVLF